MNRNEMLHQLITTSEWDIVIIGGGATGLGAALDATSRGYKTLLVEQHDFAKGTSSRSTKLVHGGVRYLERGNVKLVREALRERGYLLHNAPHLTSVQPFIVPVYKWWEKMYYAIGLKMYDLLSGKLSLGKTQVLSKKETSARLPAIDASRLAGGILYFDGQFDDSRLCMDLATTAAAKGAALLNYCKATGFEKTNEKISGVLLTDAISGETYVIKTRSVINATGVFTDAVLQMDDAARHELVSPSQGIHLVVDKSFFPGTHAMMIPKTDDGRVLFAVPWHDKVVLGTTDTPIEKTSLEPKPLEEEIEFIIKHINRYGKHTILRSDVKSVFAGLRPLVKVQGKSSTALLSRDHTLVIATSGLVTITGGKWTTYRKMAEDAVDNAVFVSKQEKRSCVTHQLPIGDVMEQQKIKEQLLLQQPLLAEWIVEGFPYRMVDVWYAVKYEMAQTAEDVLARRTRILFLDAAAAVGAAPKIASMMSVLLHKDTRWEQQQVVAVNELAKQHLLS